MSTILNALLIQLLRLHVSADEIGYCNTQPANPQTMFDLRCCRHNYTDFRDTHMYHVNGHERVGWHTCYVTECMAPHLCMDDICPTNKTRACMSECARITNDTTHQFFPFPPCHFMPDELHGRYKIPTVYTLRFSDELFNVNSSYNYLLSGRGNNTHCVEIERAMDWCNDRSNGRMYNGTYVLCREEKDVWRVMAEFGNRATHCIRYYIQKNFLKHKDSAEFKKDMHVICANFETELQKDLDLAKTHTTERHSVEVNTYNACCFLMKSRLIEKFNCTGESTTRYPNTPAPTVEHELRIEGELKVYDESLLRSAVISKTIAFYISIYLLLYKC